MVSFLDKLRYYRSFRKHVYCENYKGYTIPAKNFRLSGKLFLNNDIFLKSSLDDLEVIGKYCDLQNISTLMDYGCGNGRLLMGILQSKLSLTYIGIDTDWKRISWLKNHYKSKQYIFKHIDVYNERYNKNGKPFKIFNLRKYIGNFDYVDVIWLHSVFSHLVLEDSIILMEKFENVTTKGSKIILTGFFEEDVENQTINPEKYKDMVISGPLHVVVYNKDYFVNMIESNVDFTLTDFVYEGSRDGQSLMVFTKN